VRGVWRLANGYLSSAAPWQIVEHERAAVVVRTGVNLVRIAAIAAWPFIPSSAERVLACLGEPTRLPPWTEDGAAALAALAPGRRVRAPEVLFPKIDAATVARLTARFAPAAAAE
jgi:methionyl-tRNA synthetase